MKKYNIINNSLGWLCFVIAAVTYLLTVEPTASFWDCPEFISQGYKLEVGHPPGNPIFMLAARFFVNFVGGNVDKVAIAVNSMSALLSAGTILLLFWTITHLVRRLIVKDDADAISTKEMAIIFGSGICGALAYTWSDTFWFSAVEGEVYAFSSFCTALVFWLILKWENQADQLHSDRYLILIAYVIGISIAVHLLNLLCIPAIVLVVYYKKFKNTNAKGSIIALGIACIIIGLILYGLVPGFIEVAQYFELLAVNVLGMGYNTGVLIYTILTLCLFIWTIFELYKQRSPLKIKISFCLSILFSGIPFIGDSLVIPVLFMIALGVYLYLCKKLHIRILNIIILCITVIFIGYSSYALLLIRANAYTPMNQNDPDNVFSLSSYMSREQYGERPLFYGATFADALVRDDNGIPIFNEHNELVTEKVTPYLFDDQGRPISKKGKAEYSKIVKSSPTDPDRYVITDYKPKYEEIPELKMFFPRIYSSDATHINGYKDWIGYSIDFSTGFDNPKLKEITTTVRVDENNNILGPTSTNLAYLPSFSDNFQFFITYQLNHMYWRYFLWNFAGRQNDLQGNGEVNRGNWISGIPFIDNPRLGDQSLLPDIFGKENKGHNVFYMLPLLLGIIGLLWQAFYSKRGIEQFWVVFFLFFMTGIAIVLYLNQTPGQPRERDYAYAGSFYAFAIWIGMGVSGIWYLLQTAMRNKAINSVNSTENIGAKGLIPVIVAIAIGLIVPIQMVSQTWDDHDRSGRYTTRDFGMNYLSSVDENGIIFTNGDNDTFPLWYVQEVEGYRTDVRVVNLSYLMTSWYATQMKHPFYNASAIDMYATEKDYAYNRLQYNYFWGDKLSADVKIMLDSLYDDSSYNTSLDARVVKYPIVSIYTNKQAALNAGIITEDQYDIAVDTITLDLAADASRYGEPGMSLGKVLSLDIFTKSISNGWNRPIYFAMTVPEKYYLGLSPYMHNTGMAYEVTPIPVSKSSTVDTEKMYRNVTEKFKWGGLDKVKTPKDIYLDETVRRMVHTTRSTLIELVEALYDEGEDAIVNDSIQGEVIAKDKFDKAHDILALIEEKLPAVACPYENYMGIQIANLYCILGIQTENNSDTQKALDILDQEIIKTAQLVRYLKHLSPDKVNTIANSDLYGISYFAELTRIYEQAGGDIHKKLDEVEKEWGVNLEQWTNPYKYSGY